MLEAAETTRVKQNKNDHNLHITHPIRLITMLGLLVFNHIFFLLKRKFLAKISAIQLISVILDSVNIVVID